MVGPEFVIRRRIRPRLSLLRPKQVCGESSRSLRRRPRRRAHDGVGRDAAARAGRESALLREQNAILREAFGSFGFASCVAKRQLSPTLCSAVAKLGGLHPSLARFSDLSMNRACSNAKAKAVL
eukprot:Selendium_serpulae@DN11133_c0_g1_i1.p3